MKGIYTLKTGEKIAVFLWNDILNNDSHRSETTYRKILPDGSYSDKEYKLKIKYDYEKLKLYFVINGQKIYFEDFEFLPVDKLVEKIKNRTDRWSVKDDELMATLIKDTDNVGIIFQLRKYETIIPYLGVAIVSDDNKQKILCIPTERYYKKSSWSYKVTLEAKDEEMRKLFSNENIYFSDLWSLIMEGKVELVNKNTYIEHQELETSKEKGFIRKLFSKPKK